MAGSVTPPSYKRLGFVVDGLNTTTGLADKAYKTAKSMTPQFLQPTVHSIEETVASYGAPAIAKVQDAGDRLLHFTDDQLDTIVNTADKTVRSVNKNVADGVTSVRDLHGTNMKTFNAAVSNYYDSIQKIADWAAERLNPVKGGRAAVDTLRAALARAKELTDPDEAAQAMTDAWSSFASIGPVNQLLKTADPVRTASLNTFYQLHDNLVRMTLYKRVVDTGASTLDWATRTTPYTLGKQYVYPWLQPFADPFYNTITKSKVINKTVDYWKPSALAA